MYFINFDVVNQLNVISVIFSPKGMGDRGEIGAKYLTSTLIKKLKIALGIFKF